MINASSSFNGITVDILPSSGYSNILARGTPSSTLISGSADAAARASEQSLRSPAWWETIFWNPRLLGRCTSRHPLGAHVRRRPSAGKLTDCILLELQSFLGMGWYQLSLFAILSLPSISAVALFQHRNGLFCGPFVRQPQSQRLGLFCSDPGENGLLMQVEL